MGYSSGRKSSRLKEPLSNGDYRKMTVKKKKEEGRRERRKTMTIMATKMNVHTNLPVH